MELNKTLLLLWHDGLEHILRKVLPKRFADILKFCISDRMFRVREGDAI